LTGGVVMKPIETLFCRLLMSNLNLLTGGVVMKPIETIDDRFIYISHCEVDRWCGDETN